MVRGTDKFTRGVGFSSRHLRYNDYLDKAHEIEGHWVGKGCERYGVIEGAVVTAEAFDRLADNRHAQTEGQITQRHNTTRIETYPDPQTGEGRTREVSNRKPFLDMTCSMPKTFSIAYGPGGLRMVRRWQDRAVAKVIAEMQHYAARQVHNGQDHVERTGEFCATRYSHDTNRSLEPQVHDHITIMNMTRSGDGRDYAVEFREIIDRSRYFTELYWDSLRADAEAAGFEVVTGEHGQPELKSLLDLVETYSQRTKDIEALVKRVEELAGTKLTNAEAKQIALASRGLDLEKFQARWAEKKALLAGFKSLDPERAEGDRLKVLREFTKEVWRASDGGLQEVSAAEVAAKQRAILTEEQSARLAAFPLTAGERRDVPQNLPLQEDLQFAIDHLFTRQSVVKDHELYEALVKHAQGKNVDPDAMRAAVENHPDLVRSRGEVTTLEHLRREVECILWVGAGRGKGKTFPIEALSDRLNPRQAEALESLLKCKDQFSALAGSAGVGKTFGLASLIERNAAAGHRVFVVAPSDKARDKVREQAAELPQGAAAAEALRSAVSLQMFQADPRLHRDFKPQDLLIVDEASFTSMEQGHWVQQWARQNGCRVLFSGDPKQLTSVEAGDHFRVLLKSSDLHTARLNQEAIIRQKPDALGGHYLQAVKLFTKGRATEAFRELQKANRITELQGPARVEAFADAILRDRAQGITVIACNPTHRENDAINDAVRSRMTALGQLGEERTVQAHRSLGWTQAQKREVNKIQPGQVLEVIRGPDKGRYWTVIGVERGKAMAVDLKGERRRFTRAHAGLFDVCERREVNVAVGDTLLTRSGTRSERGEIVNGEVLEVTGWDAQGNPVAKDGRSIVGRNFTHGYASTSYRVQGDTADKVLLGFDRDSIRWASQKIAYVMASRGRIDLELFVENVADLSQIQNRKGDRKAATEMEFKPAENDRRPEVELFRQLQRLRSPNVAETDRAQAVDRCRQAAEAIRKSEVYPGRRMSAYERSLWKRAAEKYPVESRTAEQQQKLERKIASMVQEHALRQAVPPAAYQQSRGQEHGMER